MAFSTSIIWTKIATRVARRCEVHGRTRRGQAGSANTEFTYGDYRDLNNPPNKIEAFYAGKLVESRDGVGIRDLTTFETETGSVYVVVPTPAGVRAGDPGGGAAARSPEESGSCGRTVGEPDFRQYELALRKSPMRADTVGPNRPVYKPAYWDKIQQLGSGRTRRPDHDLPAAGDPAGGPAPMHLSDGERYHPYLCIYAKAVDGGGFGE